MKNDLIKKFTSRKFIVTAISLIAGIITMIFGHNETVEVISSAAMIVVPAIVYCFMEGKIDAANAKTIVEVIGDSAELLGAQQGVVDAIENAGEVVDAILGDTEEREE